MASTLMDMALDDIITQHEGSGSRGRFGRGRGGRGRGRGGPPRNTAFVRRNRQNTINARRSENGSGFFTQKDTLDEGTVWEHDLFEEEEEAEVEEYQPKRVGGGRGSRVLATNLEYTVNDKNLKEVFENFGYSVRKINVHYDKSGRSDGTADIIFGTRGEAVKAVEAYNGISIEGKPVTLVLQDDLGSSSSGVLRVGGLTVSTGRAKVGGASASAGGRFRSDVRQIRFSETRGSFGRGRGGRGRGRGRGGRRSEVSQDDLNRELDEYNQTA